MSDGDKTSPAPPGKRRGLAPPPRGQALTRLQDLERGLDAVNTASSNAAAPARPAREPTTRITVDMPDSLHRRLSLLSAETRRSLKDLVLEALETTYFRPGGGAGGGRGGKYYNATDRPTPRPADAEEDREEG